MVAAATTLLAQPEASRLENLESENNALRKRLDALEAMVNNKGVTSDLETSDSKGMSKTWKFLSDSQLTGFVTASYFHDTSDPADGTSNGYLWNNQNNELTLNKIKLTLENPAERSGEEWSAGYHVAAIFGKDSPYVNTGGEQQGLEEIRQAYFELNAPVGSGLNIKAGQLISLLNFESGDGGVVNPNFSQGNQWFFTGNGPSTGAQLGYAFTDSVDGTIRVQNGMYTGAADNNNAKTVMGGIGVKPDDQTWLKFLGVAGDEVFGGKSETLSGGQFLGSRQLGTSLNLNIATELTYMNWDNASLATTGDAAEVWSAGMWLWADFTEKWGAALRCDYIDDQDGTFTSVGLVNSPANTGQELSSLTFTVNYRPVPSVKIQPEVRFEHSSNPGQFDGENDRVILGIGGSYAF